LAPHWREYHMHGYFPPFRNKVSLHAAVVLSSCKKIQVFHQLSSSRIQFRARVVDGSSNQIPRGVRQFPPTFRVFGRTAGAGGMGRGGEHAAVRGDHPAAAGGVRVHDLLRGRQAPSTSAAGHTLPPTAHRVSYFSNPNRVRIPKTSGFHSSLLLMNDAGGGPGSAPPPPPPPPAAARSRCGGARGASSSSTSPASSGGPRGPPSAAPPARPPTPSPPPGRAMGGRPPRPGWPPQWH